MESTIMIVMAIFALVVIIRVANTITSDSKSQSQTNNENNATDIIKFQTDDKNNITDIIILGPEVGFILNDALNEDLKKQLIMNNMITNPEKFNALNALILRTNNAVLPETAFSKPELPNVPDFSKAPDFSKPNFTNSDFNSF